MRAETDTFQRSYANILWPYTMNPTNISADPKPQEASLQVYATSNKGMMDFLILWHLDAGPSKGLVMLLNLILQYTPCMLQTMSPCDNLKFASNRKINCDAIGCTN